MRRSFTWRNRWVADGLPIAVVNARTKETKGSLFDVLNHTKVLFLSSMFVSFTDTMPRRLQTISGGT